MYKVFVYGTLLSGMGNNRLLSTAKYLGEAKTKPDFLMVDLGWFPGVIESDSGVSIKGEVYEVDESTLHCLDTLEGFRPNNPDHGLYNRKEIETSLGPAIIYIYNHYHGRTPKSSIPDGDWKAYYINKRYV